MRASEKRPCTAGSFCNVSANSLDLEQAPGYYPGQGLAGVEQAAIVGLVFGAICAITGSLFTLMFAHVAFDVTAVTIIYYNLEFKVAHFIFK